MPDNSQRGAIHYIILIIIVLGLIALLYLSQHQVNLFPKAYDNTASSNHISPSPSVNYNGVTGLVFEDKNGDGIQQPLEYGVDGMQFIIPSGIAPIGTDYPSNVNGMWNMDIANLNYSTCPSCAKVVIVMPPGWETTTGDEYPLNLSNDNNIISNQTINTGVRGIYSISGTVFKDLNHNGISDPDEPIVPNTPVHVRILDLPNTSPQRSQRFYITSTDASGNYTLTHIPPIPKGQYWDIHVFDTLENGSHELYEHTSQEDITDNITLDLPITK